MAQAQILHRLVKHKQLKCATNLLGFQDAKTKKTCENAIENVRIALSSFGNQEIMIYELLAGKLQLLLWHQPPQEIEW